MSTQTVLTSSVAAAPRVNLMPPEIADAARFRQIQLAMGGAVVLSAVVVGALYMHAKSGISAAQSQVTAAQAQQTSLQSKLNSLSNVSTTYASVQAKQALLQQAMGQEIRWSYLLNDLSFRIPSNVWLTDISANENVAGSTSTASLSPGATATDVGSITFQGKAFKHDDLAAWLDALAKERGLENPLFSSSVEGLDSGRKEVTWSSSTDITTDSLSNHYVAKAGS